MSSGPPRPDGRPGLLLYPAIDILDGQAVRLVQGRFADPTTYHDDPLDAARAWVDGGARALHVVDLDGAREGRPVNLGHVRRIAGEAGVPVQCGGGLRSAEAVADALATGAERAIVGTAAYRDADFLEAAVRAHGERIAVAVDVRGGSVSAAGWTESTELTAEAVITRLAEQGVRTAIYTDVDRDGMLTGPDVETVRRLAAAVPGELLYSGGVGSLEDLGALSALAGDGLAGVVVGKALYEGRFTVGDAQRALGD